MDDGQQERRRELHYSSYSTALVVVSGTLGYAPRPPVSWFFFPCLPLIRSPRWFIIFWDGCNDGQMESCHKSQYVVFVGYY